MLKEGLKFNERIYKDALAVFPERKLAVELWILRSRGTSQNLLPLGICRRRKFMWYTPSGKVWLQ